MGSVLAGGSALGGRMLLLLRLRLRRRLTLVNVQRPGLTLQLCRSLLGHGEAAVAEAGCEGVVAHMAGQGGDVSHHLL